MAEEIFKKLNGIMEYEKDLSQVVAYKMGGKAKYFYTPKNASDLLVVLEICETKGIPLFVLGSGTNVLVSDSGFEGLVLWLGPSEKNNENEVKVLTETKEEVRVQVPAHFAKAKLLDIALKNNWASLEFSAGIPGTLGGAVFMNAGTKWGSYGEVVSEVEFVSIKKGIYSLKNEDIGFKYRGHGEGLLDGRTVVSSVTLTLRKAKSKNEILSKVDEILSYRGLRQPLELPNCGSVFKNPINSEKGAGRLIEACGLKGLRRGNAEVSLKHANFILNCGNAKAQDVKGLIDKIRESVFSKFNILLETEVIFVGVF